MWFQPATCPSDQLRLGTASEEGRQLLDSPWPALGRHDLSLGILLDEPDTRERSVETTYPTQRRPPAAIAILVHSPHRMPFDVAVLTRPTHWEHRLHTLPSSGRGRVTCRRHGQRRTSNRSHFSPLAIPRNGSEHQRG